MAIERQIIIDVDSNKAEKNLDGVIKQFDTLGKEAVGSIKNIEKGVDNTEKATKSLAQGFKGVGVAIKAMGIGLVLEAFNILKDLFQSNQVIADKFGAAFKSLSIAFNDFFNYINKNADGVVKFFKNIFENPVESLKNFGNLIKENIIERFNSALEVAGFMADALKKLFTGDFKGALESVKEAGKEMVDVFTGVDDTTGKVGKLVDKVVDYAKETWNAAEALQAQENAAKLAEAQQARLVEQYDRQAEKLRQLRDDDSKSIAERQKANDDLSKVLDEQEKAMIRQANLQIQAAQNNLKLNNTIENRVALTQALANKDGVLAQIEGFRSEQIANRIALEKESIELLKSKSETETQLAINQKLFEAERVKDEVAKLEAQKEAMENERTLELERLQNNINLYKEGTQARIDAENEYALRKQEIDNNILLKEDEIANQKLEIEKRVAEGRKAIQEASFAVAEQGISVLKGVFEKNKAIQKGLILAESAMGIAKIVTSTQAANAADRAAAALMGPAGSAYLATKLVLNKVGAAVGIAANIAATSKALSALGGGGASGGASGANSPTGAPPAPTFNVVGNSGVNQIAQTLGQQQPIQAYVVANQVTTQQALDRNIVTNASLG